MLFTLFIPVAASTRQDMVVDVVAAARAMSNEVIYMAHSIATLDASATVGARRIKVLPQ